MDIELRNMLWENVRKMNKAGMTIILTTHYLEEAEEMCDEIAIINHGEKIAQDSTVNLLDRLNAKTMVIEPDGTASAEIVLPEGVDLAHRAGGALAFTYDRAKTPAEALLAAVHTAGITIKDVKTEDPDLEDVFLALTSKG